MEEKAVYRTFQFENDVSWKSGRRGLLSAPKHATVEVGSPPAFKGDPDVWCPEDLLIAGLNTCLMLTFLTMAHRRNLRVIAYESHALGIVDHSGGKYRVTNVRVRPMVSLAESVDPAVVEQVVQQTVASCIITNSVSATVEFVPQVRSVSSDAA